MVFLFLVFNHTVACKSDCVDKKRAIIVVPGVLSSGLFYNNKTNFKYRENEALWLGITNNKMRSARAVLKFLAYGNDLYCDENGVPVNKNIGPSRNDNFPSIYDKAISKYGVFCYYKKVLDLMEDKFGNGTEYNRDVLLYSYDWRLSCFTSAALLTNEITKYDEVILIGFSMGGLVSCKSASELLQMGEISRIKMFISVGVPYNGSVESLYTLEKGLDTGNGFKDSAMKFFGITEILKNMSSNCPAMYEFLPTREFFRKKPSGYIARDQLNCGLGYDETAKIISERRWYKKHDGTNKNFLDLADNFHKSLYIKNLHIVNYLNAYFVVGVGYKTKCELNLAQNSKAKTTASRFTDGDGTIPLEYSAIPPQDPVDYSKIFKVKSIHNKIFNNPSCVDYMVNLVKNNM